MCGIFFCAQNNDSASTPSHETLECLQRLRDANAARGPDAQQSHAITLPDSNKESVDRSSSPGISLEFFASELRLRGDSPVIQPHEKDGDILCWNGEVFGGMDIAPQENDGVKVFEALRGTRDPEDVCNFFASIEGPYAFVFYSKATQKLYFGRDPLGRRSLLIHRPTSRQTWFLLASVSAGIDAAYSFEEVSTSQIQMIDLQMLGSRDLSAYEECMTPLPRQSSILQLPYAEPANVNLTLPPENHPIPPLKPLSTIPEWLEPQVDQLISRLDLSIYARVRDIPRVDSLKAARVAVLFSGGIDCTILTLLADRHIPRDEPIDLLNVAFENPRKTKLKAEGNVAASPKREKKKRTTPQTDTQVEASSYMVPDRVTGLQEVEELRRLCPGRTWNFIEINVPYEESKAARPIVEALMLPSRTVMDLSLAQALYFASRGTGFVRASPEAEPVAYTSTARVLLNGLGSDELLGGYSRHRMAFTHVGGWEAVIKEVEPLRIFSALA
ncbi:hypothetical protein V5O48_006834 [Marasmius crinis-equi]|uniref:Glutamine amidotransferase type-2 domain-containing protein n=1 Tax=Marasmius crinis-equi TaxID=585013 RepID=A0ABR3FIF4_9AGAR